jgi:glycosyltransferase involved in cell wall biosynthesis
MLKPPARVAHLFDQPSGGAAIAANRLIQALGDGGDVQLERWFFGKPEIHGRGPMSVALEQKMPKSHLERLVRIFWRSGAQAIKRIRQRTALFKTIADRKPDILHLHNLHASALKHGDIALIPKSVRLIWTMHDCWAWAPWAYRWSNEDGKVEVQGVDSHQNSFAYDARHSFFRARPDTVLVSPSIWLASEAKQSLLEGVRMEMIANGIDIDVYSPIDKTLAKSNLGLNSSKKWFGLSAASFDHRKGADLLLRALECFTGSELGIVLWGGRENFNVPDTFETYSAGYVSDENLQILLYSACDVFVCPSRIDNLPNTIMESMACGTPVIASRTGGIPEMVCPGETGWMFESGKVSSCRDALQSALDFFPEWPAYGARSRRAIEGRFSSRQQAENYKTLYMNALNHNFDL